MGARRFMPVRQGTKEQNRDCYMIEFLYKKRATMMPVICADGTYGSPFFVFEGTRVYIDRILRDGVVYDELRTA